MSAIYYLDGNNLSNSTAIFEDVALSICAADGFYSDGIVSREQVNCLLLPEQECIACSGSCTSEFTLNGNEGVYLITADMGGTSADTGAVIITFDPELSDNGIRATYGSAVFNRLSSPVDGYHASTNPSAYTFIGGNVYDCGITGTTYTALTEYESTGAPFVPTGLTQDITVAAGDVSLGGGTPGSCVIVVPKVNSIPTDILVEIAGVCPGASWTFNISCPIKLTGYPSSQVMVDSSTACAVDKSETFYNAPVTGSPGLPNVFDWVFSDPNGEFILPNGYYGFGSARWMLVENGIIISIGVC